MLGLGNRFSELCASDNDTDNERKKSKYNKCLQNRCLVVIGLANSQASYSSDSDGSLGTSNIPCSPTR